MPRIAAISPSNVSSRTSVYRSRQRNFRRWSPRCVPLSLAEVQRGRAKVMRDSFLRYCDSGTIGVSALHVTFPSLPPALGRRQSREGRPMGSTHPPLESLLELSHNCLEGFELSRLNRISNLRKEFHQLLAEWIEFEIEARFARWVLEYRRLADLGALATQNVVPAFAPPGLALRGATHESDQFLLPSGNELPAQFPFASMLELRESVAVELRLPFRPFSVSQDASAALHSLEHFARCKARSIGESPVFLPDFDAPDSSAACSFLSFSRREPAHELRNVSSRLSCVLASTNQSVRYIVRFHQRS